MTKLSANEWTGMLLADIWDALLGLVPSALPRRTLLSLLSGLVLFATSLRAQENGFNCEEHNLFVDRFPGIHSLSPLADGSATRLLASQKFSGFSSYGFDSVTLSVRFDRDPGSAQAPRPSGGIRIDATFESAGQLTTEIRDVNDWKRDPRAELATLLRARLTAPNPTADYPGTPNFRIEQPEPGLPVFLVKFVGIVAAGGWGDVDSDNAMVLDLRQGTLTMPAALGCIKDDFAGHGPGGGWANCRWERSQHDYDCNTSQGGFLLLSGRKLRKNTDAPNVERIQFQKGRSSAVVTGSLGREAVKEYIFSVAKADQRLVVGLDSDNQALKFRVVELGADPSGEMGIIDCDDNPEKPCTNWEGDLPDAAEYVIRLYVAAKPAKYTLRVSIR